jgi:predicted acyltransferase
MRASNSEIALPIAATPRWDALDVFRGLVIMLMLLNLTPGSWATHYSWLEHAKWEGGTLIDMVAPGFLFCIGCALPLSFARRAAKGATRGALLKHVVRRAALLVAIGFFLNLYPDVDFATMRIPGVLQRIGLCYGLSGAFVLATARTGPNSLELRPGLVTGATLVILVSYWLLLYVVPVPGYGAPRFDPVGSWPAVIDRAVIGVPHLFKWWPVDGRVVFDPEGIVSTWPACSSILVGMLAGLALARGRLARPALAAVLSGIALMALGLALHCVCPIIKNLWTGTFVLCSSGFSLAGLGLLMPVSARAGIRQLLAPARIFGENPLLAYILCFLVMPLIDANVFGTAAKPVSLRSGGQAFFERLLEPRAASLAFGLCGLALLLAVLVACHRRRWILRL